MTDFRILNTSIEQFKDGFGVEILFADGPDFETAETAVHFHTKWEAEAQYPHLPELQVVALRRVRDALNEEIDRLTAIAGLTR